jgi:hypothetical protein
MTTRLKYVFLALCVFYASTAISVAADGTADVDSTAFYAAVAGCIVPAAAYVVNHYAPWVSEATKGVVFAVLGAGAGAVTQLLDNGTFDFDTKSLKIVLVAMFFAFASHAGFWKPSTLSTRLGGGTNSPRSRHR